MKKLFLSTTGIILCALVLQSQTITSGEIDTLVQRTLTSFDVPGIAVSVIKDGQIVHMKGYGKRSLATGDPVDENTLFGIASNSKAFTSAALSILVEEKILNWDDKVIDYIPEFRLYNSYVTDDFRIRDLLCHRSGMGLGAGDLMIWPDGTDFSRMDVIKNLKYLKQVSPFRSKYDYDNLLYIVAGEIVAKVSGSTWEEFIEQRIMKPLKMDHSAATFNRLKDTSNVIAAHAPVDGKISVVQRTTGELMNAAGGIYSSVSDMSKWVLELMNKEKQVLSKSQVEYSLWAPQTIIPVNNPGRYSTHFSAYGLGFRLADESGYKVVSHTGGLAGMVTQVTMVPELNLGIIVFTNQQSGGAFTAITNEIKDRYFGLEDDVDWVTMLASAAGGSMERASKIVEEVWNHIKTQDVRRKTQELEIIGNYEDPWLGVVHIKESEGRFFFKADRSPGLDGEIFWYKANTYVVKWKDRSMDADAFMMFQLDQNGNPSTFTMKAISPLTDFSYDFHDLNFTKK